MNANLPIVSAVAGAAAARYIAETSPNAIGDPSVGTAERNALLPASGAFAIWGVIYAGLSGLMLLQAARGGSEGLVRARPWLAVTPWLHVAWFREVGRGEGSARPLAIQSIMWPTAIALHRALYAGQPAPEGLAARALYPTAGIYAGWLTAATFPAVAGLALESGWEGEEPESWGTAGVVAAAGIGAVGARLLDDPWFGVPVVNALAGIAVRQARQGRPVVATAAGALAAVGAVGIVRGLRRKWRRRKEENVTRRGDAAARPRRATGGPGPTS